MKNTIVISKEVILGKMKSSRRSDMVMEGNHVIPYRKVFKSNKAYNRKRGKKVEY